MTGVTGVTGSVRAAVPSTTGSCDTAAASSARGMNTLAVVPPSAFRSSVTVMPCRRASRLTTKRPIRRAVSAVTSAPVRSVSFSSSRDAWSMPRPWSWISTSTSPAGVSVVTVTEAVGGENVSALSTSSVKRWTRSGAALPESRRSGAGPSRTRW